MFLLTAEIVQQKVRAILSQICRESKSQVYQEGFSRWIKISIGKEPNAHTMCLLETMNMFEMFEMLEVFEMLETKRMSEMFETKKTLEMNGAYAPTTPTFRTTPTIPAVPTSRTAQTTPTIPTTRTFPTFFATFMPMVQRMNS